MIPENDDYQPIVIRGSDLNKLQIRGVATMVMKICESGIYWGVNMQNIEQIIKNTTEENQSKTDWTKAWSANYPILSRYQGEVDIPSFAGRIRMMLTELQEQYGYSELDAMLVLKDILAHEYMDNRKQKRSESAEGTHE